MFFFFFQAEDGIRDSSVTGVQTCALPISIFVCYCGIEKGASRRKRPDGKLPAGNRRQFRCYCPLEPFRKACILAVLTEGQRTRVTVSGNRFLAEFRRATEYRMTPTDQNTPFGPS